MPQRTKGPKARSARRKASGGGSGSRGWRIALRVALVVLALLVLLAAGVSVAVHRILTTATLRGWVNGEPEKLRLEYSSASGWFPWDVRVRDLELRARDSNVEWYLRIDEARVAIAPFELLGRRLHFTSVRAKGLAFRLRVRVPPSEASPAHFAALPPIPGYPARPLRDESDDSPASRALPPGPAAPPSPPSSSRPLHITVTGLDVDGLREVWIDIWRLRGKEGAPAGRLVGSFDLSPHLRASVGPTHLELPDAALSLGPHAVAGPVTFSTDASIRAFDPREVHGNDVWPYISGRARLEGPFAGLELLNHFLRNSPEPRLSGGAGTLATEITVENGKGRGTLTTASRGVTARYHDATITADVAARIRIPAWDVQHDRLDISGTRISLDHVVAGEPGPDSRDWWGRFDLAHADVQGGRPGAFRADVTTHCRDARPLFTLFDVGLPGWARGVLKLEGLDARAKIGLGSSYTDVEGLDATGGAFRIRGEYRERKAARSGAFLLETGDHGLALGLEIEGPSSRLKVLNARKWFEERGARAAK